MSSSGTRSIELSPPSAPMALIRPDGGPIRVMVVDDDRLSAELISLALRREGWTVSFATDGAAARRVIRQDLPDLVVLEVELPGTDGLAVIHGLREICPSVPVMLMSKRCAVEDRVNGLSQGGDDYVTKPYHIEEVVLRLRALAKRSGIGIEPGLITVGNLVLNEHSHEFARGGGSEPLTATEYKILRLLMLNARRIVSKSQILQEVWGCDFGGSVNNVEIYISYLRKKIDNGRAPMIHTVRGCGYILKP
jgi:two-component system OmpR family response regulator